MVMDKACAFCGIVAGRLPAHRIYEDSASVAFLDRRPLFPGHVLLVPRSHVETLGTLEQCEIEPLFGACRLLSRAVERGLGCQGTFVAINNRVSQSVPHLHLHIVPRNKGDGLRGFFWPRNPYQGPEHVTQIQKALKAAVEEELKQLIRERSSK